jgi:hypothetical protein
MALEKLESGKGYVHYEDDTVLLKGVRLSFPHIATSYKGKDDSFGFKLMIHKEEQAEIASFLKKRIKAGFSELKVAKLSPDRLFMRNGDDSERESEQGYYIISANSKKPLVALDKFQQRVDDATTIEEMFYAGCYVNAVIKPWVQNDKEFGKRVNAYANAVQFVKDGDPLGSSFNTDNYDWDRSEDEPMSGIGEDEDDIF